MEVIRKRRDAFMGHISSIRKPELTVPTHIAMQPLST
jgi:hypothetical protein